MNYHAVSFWHIAWQRTKDTTRQVKYRAVEYEQIEQPKVADHISLPVW